MVSKPSVKTLMAPSWLGGRAESADLSTAKRNHIHFRAFRVSSVPAEYSVIEMGVFGSEPETGELCMYINEGRMYFCPSTDFLAITLTPSLRIVKAIFGHLRL